MKFFPKEICEKFLEIGCKADVDYFYLKKDHPWKVPAHKWQELNGKSFECREDKDLVQAFTPWDFIGTSEQARKNAEILWPGEQIFEIPCPDNRPSCLVFHTKKIFLYEERRHAALDAPDAMEYIMRFVKWKN